MIGKYQFSLLKTERHREARPPARPPNPYLLPEETLCHPIPGTARGIYYLQDNRVNVSYQVPGTYYVLLPSHSQRRVLVRAHLLLSFSTVRCVYTILVGVLHCRAAAASLHFQPQRTCNVRARVSTFARHIQYGCLYTIAEDVADAYGLRDTK